MFTNENSADAVYGSLDEARWSMECDENGNVLSIWWNEGTCHLMGYDLQSSSILGTKKSIYGITDFRTSFQS